MVNRAICAAQRNLGGPPIKPGLSLPVFAVSAAMAHRLLLIPSLLLLRVRLPSLSILMSVVATVRGHTATAVRACVGPFHVFGFLARITQHLQAHRVPAIRDTSSQAINALLSPPAIHAMAWAISAPVLRAKKSTWKAKALQRRRAVLRILSGLIAQWAVLLRRWVWVCRTRPQMAPG